MAVTDVQTDPEPSRHQFELEQFADDSQYVLHSKSEIVAVLRTIIQKGVMITAHFDQGKSFLLTSLIALTAGNRQFFLDVGSNEEMNRRALLSDKIIFTTTVDKVKVEFILDKLSPTLHEGRPAFLASVPEKLLRLQRREHYRLSTPIVNPVILAAAVRRADGSGLTVDVPLLDISGGGLGLMATPEQSKLFPRGVTLRDCALALPDEGLLVTALCVRSLFDLTTRSGAQFVHVGCEYVELQPSTALSVQRYIIRIERERKARLAGMA